MTKESKEGKRLAAPANNSLILLLIVVVAAFSSWFSLHSINSLPEAVQTLDVRHNGFSEAFARSHIKVLAEDIGIRMVGTAGERQATEYLYSKLLEYKTLAEDNEFIKNFDVMTQVSDGHHRFDLLHQIMFKLYTNVTNVIVHISCGPECDKNALLLNAHYDSQLGTTGATDDGLGVAVLMEIARLNAIRTEPMRNSIILLFNGGEESFQDASYAFVTQHKLAKNVRAFLNVEAMGNSGKTILFQINSPELAKVYTKVPRPYGSVLSNDIFATGVILSDTDFRQFVEHGNYIGMDFALFQNSWVYHTMLDTLENVPPSVFQFIGENIEALVRELTSSGAELETFTKGQDFIYFDFFGQTFFVIMWPEAITILSVVAVALVFILLLPVFRNMPLLSNSSMVFNSVSASLLTLGSTIFAFLMTIIFAVIWGLAFQFVFNKPLQWFKNESHAALQYLPPAFLGAIIAHWICRYTANSRGDTNVAYERRVWNTLLTIYLVLSSLAGYFHVGSGHVVLIQAFCLGMGLLSDRLLSPPGNGFVGSQSPVHALAYVVGLALPFALYVAHGYGFLLLFVPLAGRLGIDAPVDPIIAFVVGLLSSLALLPLQSLFARFSTRAITRMMAVVALLTVASSFIMLTSFPFDEFHPKRILIQYTHDLVNNTRTLDVSHIDPVAFDKVVKIIGNEFGGIAGKRQDIHERDYSWGSYYPVSPYLESHIFDITNGTVRSEDLLPPEIRVVENTYDAKEGTKRVTLEIYHPHHIWNVIKFTGHVVSWSLAAEPFDEVFPYYVRAPTGYGAETFSITVTFKVASPSDKIQFRLSAFEQDSLELIENWHNIGGAKHPGNRHIHAWTSPFASGEILRRVQKILPSWVVETMSGTVIMILEV